jgi:hypothetical protein
MRDREVTMAQHVCSRRDVIRFGSVSLAVFAAGRTASASACGENTGSPGGLRLRVVNGPLNVRDFPSLDGQVITTIPAGATMRVTQADGGTWADGYHWIAVKLELPLTGHGFVADMFTAPV